MIKATLTFPKLETRKVWAGMYGGHLDVIVFFKARPARTRRERESLAGLVRVVQQDGSESKVLPYEIGNAGAESEDNKEKCIGAMWLEDFFAYFPGMREALKPYTQDDRPKAIEIPEVFQIEMTAQFTDDGNLASVDMHADGW